MKVEAAECSAGLTELSPAIKDADLPTSDESMQPTVALDAGPEASLPIDGTNMDLFHGLPDLDNTFSFLGKPSDGLSLAVSLPCASNLFTYCKI